MVNVECGWKNKSLMMRNFFFCARSSIHHFPTRRKLHFLLQAKIRLNVKQISKYKNIVFAPDSSKATIVSKAFYDSEGSYSPIPEAFSSFLNVFLDLFARSPTNSRTDRLSTKNAETEDLLSVDNVFSYMPLRCAPSFSGSGLP